METGSIFPFCAHSHSAYFESIFADGVVDTDEDDPVAAVAAFPALPDVELTAL